MAVTQQIRTRSEFWHGKRVLLTGHTGFKGGWLALWLKSLGAEVHGFALMPSTTPGFFEVANVGGAVASNVIGDLRDAAVVAEAVRASQAEIVLHLAAQPLVRRSFEIPAETYAVNVMGTVHVLDAARAVPSVRAILVVTTDKCYENQEWPWGYRETEPMGGYDPYSSSKGCAELVTSAYRRSFFGPMGVGLASARAGNVIGGGDWADDRLLPDILRAWDRGETVRLRSPHAVRPWQHVLEPLAGYLTLAERLHGQADAFAGGWNFGPVDEDARTVQWIVEAMAAGRADRAWAVEGGEHVHEAHFLKLDSSKARQRLDWSPRWGLRAALDRTMEWHTGWKEGRDMQTLSLAQIAAFEAAGKVG